MSKYTKMSGFANVLAGLEDMADMSSEKKVAVGTPVDYGRYLEEGTRNMPPYPWLQPAVDGVAARSGSILQGSDDIDTFIETVAREMERDAIRRLDSTGTRPYRQTGNLAGSVTVEEL